jgi:Cu+-exporting ATPase
VFTHDPVCGKRISRRKARAAVQYGGDTYYVCSALCRAIFDHDPARHLSAGSKSRSGGGLKRMVLHVRNGRSAGGLTSAG